MYISKSFYDGGVGTFIIKTAQLVFEIGCAMMPTTFISLLDTCGRRTVVAVDDFNRMTQEGSGNRIKTSSL